MHMVPEARVELARCRHRRILSPLRLPIPPLGHAFAHGTTTEEARTRSDFRHLEQLHRTHHLAGIEAAAATEEGDLAFTGDTLFPGGHGRTDLEGGDDATIMRTLARLFTVLPEDTLCLIGHNGTTTVAQELCANPFVREALRAHAS